MTKHHYYSKLSHYIVGLLKEKCMCGYSYDFEAYIFKRFDRFIINNNFDNGILSKLLVDKWSIQQPTESINYRNQRVSFIRQLGKYIISLGNEAYIPILSSDTPIADPYILSYEEIQNFIKFVDIYRPIGHIYLFQPASYSIIFRLFICCGLRLSEVINLKFDDVNFDDSIIHIFHSKGDKDRKVFMPNDLSLMCKNYNKLVNSIFKTRKWFFISINPDKHLHKSTLDGLFKRLWKKSGCYKPYGKNPTIHSLRHTYVVLRLNKWIAEGIDIQTMMPYLSKQLGHSSVDGTQYYYHTVRASAKLIRNIDKSSNNVIPKVENNENKSSKFNNRQNNTSTFVRKTYNSISSSLIPKVK
jgi:integrase